MVVEFCGFHSDAKVFLVAFSYAMSTTADNWKALMDRLLTLEDSNSTEKVLVRNNLVRLIDLYYEALDAPKSGKEVSMFLFQGIEMVNILMRYGSCKCHCFSSEVNDNILISQW